LYVLLDTSPVVLHTPRMKTMNQYKQDERDRKRAAGMVCVQEWVPRDYAPRLKALATRLRSTSYLAHNPENIDECPIIC